MSKGLNKNKRSLKKVYVTEETLAKLFTYKYENKHKNIDEVIKDLLIKANKDSSK